MAVTVEGAIVAYLRTVSDVTTKVSTFEGYPAIFTDRAPAEAVEPYLVFDVKKSPSNSLALDVFDVEMDIYHTGLSSLGSNALNLAVEFALDRAILNCTNYINIRFYRDFDGHVYDDDIKINHYNQRFEARGTRNAWILQL